MSHNLSVFANACVNVPVDPLTKMPKTAYERKRQQRNNSSERCSIASSTTVSSTTADIDSEKLKEFYRSIPDYSDVNHLPPEEFYSTLRILREKKRHMLGHALEHVDDVIEPITISNEEHYFPSITKTKPQIKSKFRRKSVEKRFEKNEELLLPNKDSLKRASRRKSCEIESNLKVSALKCRVEGEAKDVKPKRNASACSITWDDTKIQRKDEVDRKFDDFFDGKDYKSDIEDDFKTRSMPTSPLRNKRFGSPIRRRKSVTVPKPFKMTERDEDVRLASELRCLQKSFSADMLDRKRKPFRARPVPIESRIPLYDKILEDQAMRRAMTKINSEADLRAQMKPFSFTKKEEKGVCSHALPKPVKRKKFRARPVPKNLFSNYVYEKKKENDFFRTMNRRIRAEELLRHSALPNNMAVRDRSRLSTPAAHSDLPIDPSPVNPSESSSDRHRSRSPGKDSKKGKRHEFITTSPQAFRLSTSERAAKKMEELTKKIYQESKSTTSVGNSSETKPRAYSALDLRTHAAGRSNLAALLRAEAVRRRFEMETSRRLEEQHRKVELRARDRILRSKPSWHMVKNNHEEDIAMRLQARRDEERMRREEFLHEMELMYGRVQQQPMLFERYYAPQKYTALDSLQLSPRKGKKTRRRKVSINDHDVKADVIDYLRWKEEGKYSDSEPAVEGSDCAKL